MRTPSIIVILLVALFLCAHGLKAKHDIDGNWFIENTGSFSNGDTITFLTYDILTYPQHVGTIALGLHGKQWDAYPLCYGGPLDEYWSPFPAMLSTGENIGFGKRENKKTVFLFETKEKRKALFQVISSNKKELKLLILDNSFLSGMAKSFDEAVAKGDSCFIFKNYNCAIDYYIQAGSLSPIDTPYEKIQKTNKLIQLNLDK